MGSSGMNWIRLPPRWTFISWLPRQDAERGHAAFFDFGEQSPFEFFANRIDAAAFGMRLFAVGGRVEVGAAAEEHAIQLIDDLRDQRMVGAIRQEKTATHRPAPRWSRSHTARRTGLDGSVVVSGDTDDWTGHRGIIGI